MPALDAEQADLSSFREDFETDSNGACSPKSKCSKIEGRTKRKRAVMLIISEEADPPVWHLLHRSGGAMTESTDSYAGRINSGA